ncbi:hypothetical protein GCM10010869_15640 [Mesorhizobium tianshanense]|uniref:Uncharacterized protein n=1 Tax=Mesorhizobium tianshanense TaxID=39844 RepID=A0A562NXM8_9HYPH|nr:hypothetical protein IQ26_02999 [Mesorhizobium tianshanense]GLS35975.1 hypothetical protein GCM10010869_15640 [Mesorhizobium tianshanense]
MPKTGVVAGVGEVWPASCYCLDGVRIIFPIIYLRKYGKMPYDSSRQAGTEKIEEIQITPEMIEAGASELSRWVSPEDYRADPRDLAIWVYSVMAKCAPN